MAVGEERTIREAFLLSNERRKVTGRLSRNNTIAQSDCVRNISDCPITLRASIDAWSANEGQGDQVMSKLHQCFRLSEDEYPNTPRSQAITVSSNTDSDPGIATAHNAQEVYGDISDMGTLEALQRPTISLGDLKQVVDLEDVLYGDYHDEFQAASQKSTPTATTYRFEQPRPIWHFFHAVASNDVYNHAEDWGIDRSIYTRYSRSGFFADCHIADSLHHGEYLDDKACEGFAEVRTSLVACVISASRDVRASEVQKGIIPLAVSLLDRYIAKQKKKFTTLLSLTNEHLESKYGSEFPLSESNKMDASKPDFPEPAEIVTPNFSVKQKLQDALGRIRLETVLEGVVKTGGEAEHYMDQIDHHNIEHNGDTDSTYDEDGRGESVYDSGEIGIRIDSEIMYNFIAAACYFIADRYNGLTNTSLNLLLDKWAGTCHQYTKTQKAAVYMNNHREAAMGAISMFMMKVTLVLEYKLTSPFPCHMVDDLLRSTPDFKISQNPSKHSLYQKLGVIMARIAYVDDTFHRFKPSIVTLSIYSLIRRLAIHHQSVKDEAAWLLVDDSDAEIRSCSELMVDTFLQFLDTDVLDALTQPVFMKQQRDDLFNLLFDDWGDIEPRDLVEIGNILLKL